jgi:hypothetical protein
MDEDVDSGDEEYERILKMGFMDDELWVVRISIIL